MKPHEEWLFKAEQDLKSAIILRNSREPVLDIAIYHTQQCAEKSFKAYLSFKNQEIDKTHNLDVLLGKCAVFDPTFNNYRESAFFLIPFVTIYRYPDGDLLPSMEKVDKAIKEAKKIFDFILETILSQDLLI
jgi:HEPN domain-containing protein